MASLSKLQTYQCMNVCPLSPPFPLFSHRGLQAIRKGEWSSSLVTAIHVYALFSYFRISGRHTQSDLVGNPPPALNYYLWTEYRKSLMAKAKGWRPDWGRTSLTWRQVGGRGRSLQSPAWVTACAESQPLGGLRPKPQSMVDRIPGSQEKLDVDFACSGREK